MRKIILPVLVVIVLIFIAGLIFKDKQNRSNIIATSSPTQAIINQNFKIFKSSSVMKFSIQVPSSYKVEERMGSVTVRAVNGEIIIGRNSTNYNNLIDYLKNSRNNYDLPSFQILNISNHECMSNVFSDQKVYFIYADNFVYLIYTKNPELYKDLDQIAQSFQYSP